MPNQLWVVFDCNVFLQAAIRADSVADQCLQLAENGVVRLVVSRAILEEIEDVLNRPSVQTQFPHLNDVTVGAFLIRLRKCAEYVRSVPVKFSYARDPNDEPYINLAAAVQAHYIVTRDKDLLSLMTGYDADGKEFRQRFRPLKVVAPVEFLRLVRAAAEP